MTGAGRGRQCARTRVAALCVVPFSVLTHQVEDDEHDVILQQRWIERLRHQQNGDHILQTIHLERVLFCVVCGSMLEVLARGMNVLFVEEERDTRIFSFMLTV